MVKKTSKKKASLKEALVSFDAHLRANGMRVTPERHLLLELILGLKGHFSADEVLFQGKKKGLSVSRATLYRLFPILIEVGVIQQSLLSEGQTKYEVTWEQDHHDHLICSNCQRVIEFQDNTIEILQREVANKYGFILEHHVMELVGRCDRCQSR